MREYLDKVGKALYECFEKRRARATWTRAVPWEERDEEFRADLRKEVRIILDAARLSECPAAVTAASEALADRVRQSGPGHRLDELTPHAGHTNRAAVEGVLREAEDAMLMSQKKREGKTEP